MTIVYKIIALVFIALCMSTALHARLAVDNVLMAEQWERSRSGEELVKIPVINIVVNRWSSQPNLKIELHYPGGEEGELWVGELRDWLVSMGVPSKDIAVIPGSGIEDVIRLHVVKIGENYR